MRIYGGEYESKGREVGRNFYFEVTRGVDENLKNHLLQRYSLNLVGSSYFVILSPLTPLASWS